MSASASNVAPASASLAAAPPSRLPPSLDDAAAEDSEPLSEPVDSKPVASNEMTLERIRAICRARPDLYDSAELNDKLFLNFGGFKEIKARSQHAPSGQSLTQPQP